MKKTIEFEELEAPVIELELEYSYSFKAGNLYGLPENCYPDEEDMDIRLPDGFEQMVMSSYIAAARQAIKNIEGKVCDMIIDGMPRRWAKEN